MKKKKTWWNINRNIGIDGLCVSRINEFERRSAPIQDIEIIRGLRSIRDTRSMNISTQVERTNKITQFYIHFWDLCRKYSIIWCKKKNNRFIRFFEISHILKVILISMLRIKFYIKFWWREDDIVRI